MSPTGVPGRQQKAVLISLSDALCDEADEISAKLHISRSEFIRNAIGYSWESRHWQRGDFHHARHADACTPGGR